MYIYILGRRLGNLWLSGHQILPAPPQPVSRARLALTGQISFLNTPPVGPPAWEPWRLLSSDPSHPTPASMACAFGPYGPDFILKHTSFWTTGLGTLASPVIGHFPPHRLVLLFS